METPGKTRGSQNVLCLGLRSPIAFAPLGLAQIDPLSKAPSSSVVISMRAPGSPAEIA
jgi:hypothetical protein